MVDSPVGWWVVGRLAAASLGWLGSVGRSMVDLPVEAGLLAAEMVDSPVVVGCWWSAWWVSVGVVGH
jgi:hypothetical protein